MKKSLYLTSSLLFIASSAYGAGSGLMTTGASSAKSAAGVAIKSISKSLTGTSASTSSSSESTSERKKNAYALDLSFVEAPNLYITKSHSVELNFAKTLSKESQHWLNTVLNDITFPFHSGILNIKTKTHPAQLRKGDSVYYRDNNLYVSQKVIANKNKEALVHKLAEKSWQWIGSENRKNYATVCGWKFHTFIPTLQVNTSKIGTTSHFSPRDDYIASILNYKKESPSNSRITFLNQLHQQTPLALNQQKLDSVQVYFCYVQDKGIAGASQGHCALVVDDGIEKTAFAYSAEFDFTKPILSASKALIGNLDRKLHCTPYEKLKEIYAGENRSTLLEKLSLSPSEKNALLYRLQECFYLDKGKYSFLRQNCANPLRDILQYAIKRDSSLNGWKTPRTLWEWSKTFNENS